MEKILITGASGFAGSNVVKHLLNKGYEICVVVRKSSNIHLIEEFSNQINIFVYDNNLGNLIKFFKKFKPKTVCHLASLFIAEHNSSQVNDLIDSNIKFGSHILEAMKEANVYNLVNTGTSWQHFNNNNLYNPVCLYAATKQAFESIIDFYVDTYNFKVITLKLYDTYGENDVRPKLINLLNKFADEKTLLNMSPGNQELCLIHISDVCDAFEISINLLNEKKIGHKKYFLYTNEIFTLKKVIDLFEKISNKKININWGGRSYRKREVMKVFKDGINLPGWNPKISLAKGLKLYIK